MGKFITFITIILVIIFILKIPTFAQTSTCGTGTARATGLVSTPSLTTPKFGTTGGCVINPRAAFVSFKIPSFDELKSLYYTQNQTLTATKHELPTLPTGDKTQDDIPFTDTTDSLYHVNGNLLISSNNQGSRSGVVFVEGDLNITGNYCYGSTCPTGPLSSSIGTVFVVKGNVYISPSILRVDAVIISQGTICTAANFSTTPPTCPLTNVTTAQLEVNGSLISLNEASPILNEAPPIKFRRTLPDNTRPAEKIIHQVKYLVILRNLYSDIIQKWSEIP